MSTGIHAPTISSAVTGDADTSLMAHLEDLAPVYFPGLDERSLDIRLVRVARRTYSALYEFDVSDGRRSHGIIVKIPFLPSQLDETVGSAVETQRPRLFGHVNPRHMAEFEFASLTAIQRHIEKNGDPRLGSVRPLELLQHPKSVVMEKNLDASLRSIHIAARRIGAGRRGIPFSPNEAIQNAGLWLREFHRIAPLPHTSDRMPTRSEFVETLAEQTGHLIDHGEHKALLRSVRSQMGELALRFFPAEFELATSHGDYAPRNLLIGRDNKVTVIDTLARWRAPIYEDVASFLFALRAPALQVVSFGWAYRRSTLRRFESHFLARYFDGTPVPLAAIRLFEALLLLDRWGAFVHRSQHAQGTRKLYSAWRLATLRSYLHQYFHDTFRELIQLG